ncbi:MAG: DNA methyltransferase [Nanoarchaeota archaeon]
MKTTHKILYQDARNMTNIDSNTVDLIVTSPPYPMIEMWDEIFSKQNPEIKEGLKKKNGETAFELMHKELDKVWNEVYRILKVGGIACINIGDATRSLNGKFQIYPNHTRIMNHCLGIGFHALPSILWIKETNSPNKFMGSGTLPVGAYVTLEHEHILLLRKNDKREGEEEEFD